MKKIALVAVLTTLAVVGCSSAKKSGDVSAVSVSVAPYLKMDCKELATEQSSLISAAEAARGSVDKKYDEDKTKEVITWLLFAPAAFFMDGNAEESAKLANIKGQLTAVQDAMKVNKCVGN